MDDIDVVMRGARMRIDARTEGREWELRRCSDICMTHLEGAVMSKYASRKECDAAREMAKAIMAEITLDEKMANAE